MKLCFDDSGRKEQMFINSSHYTNPKWLQTFFLVNIVHELNIDHSVYSHQLAIERCSSLSAVSLRGGVSVALSLFFFPRFSCFFALLQALCPSNSASICCN